MTEGKINWYESSFFLSSDEKMQNTKSVMIYFEFLQHKGRYSSF